MDCGIPFAVTVTPLAECGEEVEEEKEAEKEEKGEGEGGEGKGGEEERKLKRKAVPVVNWAGIGVWEIWIFRFTSLLLHYSSIFSSFRFFLF